MSKPLNRFGTNGPSANIMQPGLMLSFKDMWDPEWDYGEPPPHRDEPWIDPENCPAENSLNFLDNDQTEQCGLTSESPIHVSDPTPHYSELVDYTENMSFDDSSDEGIHSLELEHMRNRKHF